ncbi:MAG: divalent metal cation transporter, partial [Chloroflexota bacterium]
SFWDAPVFFSLYTALIVIGGLVVLIPGLSLIQIMLLAQIMNGLLLPVALVFILLLSNNRRLMGEQANGRVGNYLGWGVTAAMLVLNGVLLVTGVGGLVA